MLVPVVGAEVEDGPLLPVQALGRVGLLLEARAHVDLHLVQDGPEAEIHQPHHSFLPNIKGLVTFAGGT